MPYKYESVLKTFEYSQESLKIISDFLLSGDKKNPEILLNVTAISKHFNKKPANWFPNPSVVSFAKSLIKIRLEQQDKKFLKGFENFLKNSSFEQDNQFIDILTNLDHKELVKLMKEVGLVSVKKGGDNKYNKSIQGTWLHKDLIEEYLKWLIIGKNLKKSDGLYLIQAGEYTKIGITQDINKRLKSMETDNPLKLKILFYQKFENANKLESYLHKVLKKFNTKNEWFKFSKKQINIITECLKSNNLSKLENYFSTKNKTKINKKERLLRILKLLKESSFTAKELAEKFNISTSTIYGDLKKLFQEGKLSKVKNGRHFVYFLKVNTNTLQLEEMTSNYEFN
jgi:ribosomal protein S25